jgi:hypothetical protein
MELQVGNHLIPQLNADISALGHDGMPVRMSWRQRRALMAKRSAHPKRKRFTNELRAGNRLQVQIRGRQKIEALFARAGVKLNLMP